jgi:hypothetical protein
MKKATFLAFALLAACGDSGGGGGGGGGGGADSPMAPTTITISGIASEITISGRAALADVMITVYKASDDSVITTATTDAMGQFSVSTTTTNGAPVDGYLKATKTGLKETYLYPPAPLAADFANVPVLMLKQSTQNLANSLGGAPAPDATKGWVALIIDDASMMPVMGATLTSTPTGSIHYNSSAGVPQAQATSTAVDGIAYAMNVPAGSVMVSATKTGTTFKSHAVNARADKVTLTLITP